MISAKGGELKSTIARLEEVLVILGNGRMNAYNVAAKMTWGYPIILGFVSLAQKCLLLWGSYILNICRFWGCQRIEIDGQIYFEIN